MACTSQGLIAHAQVTELKCEKIGLFGMQELKQKSVLRTFDFNSTILSMWVEKKLRFADDH